MTTTLRQTIDEHAAESVYGGEMGPLQNYAIMAIGIAVGIIMTALAVIHPNGAILWWKILWFGITLLITSSFGVLFIAARDGAARRKKTKSDTSNPRVQSTFLKAEGVRGLVVRDNKAIGIETFMELKDCDSVEASGNDHVPPKA